MDRCTTGSDGTAANACRRPAAPTSRGARPGAGKTLQPAPWTRNADTRAVGVRALAGRPPSWACREHAAWRPPRPSRSPTFYVEDPGGVERGAIHASPPGREVPARGGVVREIVADGDVVEWRRGQPGCIRPHPVDGGVGVSRLAEAFALEVLVDERDGRGPQWSRRRRAAGLALLAAEADVEPGGRIRIGGDVGHLPQPVPCSLGDGLLVIGHRVELAGAATRTDLSHRAAPGSLLEIDALHRLEHGRAANRRDVRERRWEACRGRRALATRICAAV